jgi:membrane protease YdiL (CAAX protease family)
MTVTIETVQVRRSLALFTVVALGVGWTALTVPLLTGMPPEPFVLATLALGLVAPALIILRLERRGQVRELFRDLVRLPRPRLLLVPAALAIPLGTLGVAALAGAAVIPDGSQAVGVAIQIVTGLVLVNLLEELVWMGFVQRRLARARGPIVAALLTAGLFAALHLPLGLAGWAGGPTAILAGVGALIVAGVALRLVIGAVDALGGSLLAAAVTHASFNAAGSFVDPSSDWIRYAVTGALAIGALAFLSSRR